MKSQAIVLNHTQLTENHSTHTMVLHPNKSDVLIAGTTIAPGSGGQVLASLAQIYFLNLTTHQIFWNQSLLPGVSYYYELLAAPETGLIYGITDNNLFFVLDPNSMRSNTNGTFTTKQ